jgi:ribonuclease HI
MSRRPTTARGVSLFADSSSAPAPKHATPAYSANIDGGSRGNPGPAAYGVVIRGPGGAIVAKLKKYIGRSTNNVAEYYGLIAALDYAQSHGIRTLCVESDSELLVKQMRGQYRVKSAELQPLFERARKMARNFEAFRIDHVYRERNTEADALANEALDETDGASVKLFGSSAKSRLGGAPSQKLRARYRNGALHLLNPLQLPEDTEVEVVVKPVPKI